MGWTGRRTESDYTATNGTLTFLANETSKTIAVEVLDDSDVEGDETFLVRLSSPRNATLRDGEGEATIEGDDGTELPTLAIDDVAVNEDAGSAVFSVTLSEQSAETVTVGYGTLDGTAEAESDYTATNGTLTFLANETSKTIAVEVLDDSDVEGDETFLVRLSSPRNATLRDGEGTATIEGDDGTELPTLAIDDVAVNEDAGSAVFSVTLSEQSAETVTVGYGTLDGTAEAESDYTATNGTLTFLANETSKTIAVEVLDDSDVEGDETFLVRLSSPRNATLRDGEGEATIEGDDGTELPTLAIDDVAVNEDAGSAVFSVTLSEQSAETVTVGYGTLDGTAEAESDYTATNGTLTFLANETSKTIAVAVLDDSDVEGDETFLVRLSSPRNATLRDGEGEATIEGDDGTELPTLAIDDVAVNEDAGSAVFSVTLSEQSAETVTVRYTTLDGTAEAESDYTATNGTLTFLANETGKTIAVAVLDDSDVEGDETFLVRLSSPRNATLRDGEGTATIAANDGGAPSLPTLSIDDVEVSEDAGSAVFRVTLSGQSSATVTVGYATLDGTAEAGSDYTATNGTLTFEPGETRKIISVPVLDDSDVEGAETFTGRLSDPRNATLGDPEATATIRDDDGDEPLPPYGLPELAIHDVTVAEDAGNAVFRVSLSHESDGAVTLEYATSDWTATAGSDYTAASGTLTFEPGQRRQIISVPVLDDSAEEGDETFTVRLSDARNATLGDPEATATIRDDDGDGPLPPSGLPELAIDDVTVAEDAGNAVFKVSLSHESDEAVSVAYATSDWTASAGSDYTAASGTLTFEPGETRQIISVPVLDDSEEEEDETFTASLSNPRNATLADAEGTATIRDDDGDGPLPPSRLPELAIHDVTVAEDAGNAVFRVSLSHESDEAVTLEYATSDWTASAGSDYTAASGTLTFEPGQRRQIISVPVLDDSEEEEDETFTASLSNPRNATLADAEGTATIRDDDGDGPLPPSRLPELAIHDVTVAEDAGNAVFRVSLSHESDEAVTLEYATSDWTASAGSDYTAASGTLTFEPGQRRQIISVPVLDDSEEEEDETFTASLSNPRNATLADAEGTATIRDDDGDGPLPPSRLPELAIHDVTVAEDAGNAVFRVSLSHESDEAVTLEYATSDWTASAGSDYTAASGTLTFEPGETRQIISVPVLDDSAEEGDETFTASLSNPRNATLADAEGTATIRDDDGDGPLPPSGLPELAIHDVTVAEDAGNAVFRVSLSHESDEAVTVAYATSDWTATAGSDYTTASGRLTFEPRETLTTIAVQMVDDDEEEGDEVFTVRLSDARNATLADREGTATITDDDQSAQEPGDEVPPEWLEHFGRTAASHVVDALDERMRCARDRRSVEAASGDSSLRWRCTRYPNGVAPDGSSFHVSSTAQQDEPGWSFWGRGSFSRFDIEGETGPVLGGGVGSATFGADLAAGRVLLGIALSHSRGGGTVTLDDVAEQVASSLTGLYPYLRLGVNERLSLWGTVGLGAGTLTLTMKDDQPLETGITMRMAAAGGLAQILSPTEENRLSVSIKADGLLVAVDANASTSFAAASVEASRLRLVLEGAYELTLGDGQWIAPFVDIGGRLDGGGAATGLGMEVGGGLRYAHPAQHLTAEIHTRALPVHASDGFRRWSLSGSLRYDPNANSELGPYFTLSSSRGLEEDGRHASWGIETLADPLQVGGAAPGWDIDTELGYGVSVLGGSATGTPWAGVSVAEGTPEYRLGYRLAFGSDLRVGLAGTLRDNATDTEPPDYQVTLRLSTH